MSEELDPYVYKYKDLYICKKNNGWTIKMSPGYGTTLLKTKDDELTFTIINKEIKWKSVVCDTVEEAVKIINQYTERLINV